MTKKLIKHRKLVSSRGQKDGFYLRLYDYFSNTISSIEFKGHSKKANSLKFIKSGKVLVSGGDDDKILFWDPKKGKIKCELYANQTSVQILLHDDRLNLLASGGGDGSIALWGTG